MQTYFLYGAYLRSFGYVLPFMKNADIAKAVFPNHFRIWRCCRLEKNIHVYLRFAIGHATLFFRWQICYEHFIDPVSTI